LYTQADAEQFTFRVARRATASGLIGAAIGLTVPLVAGLPWGFAIFLAFLLGYLSLTGYWGIHGAETWYQRYRYEWTPVLWYALRPVVVIVGCLLGWVFFGVYEHFMLLLAMTGSGDIGVLRAQICLLPYIGPKITEKVYFKSQGPGP